MSNNTSGLDFRKLLTIALKDVLVTFRDRALVLIMIAAPLAITLIIAAAFSKFTSAGSNDLPVERPAVAVVNLDKGVTIFGQQLNFGAIVTSVLAPENASSAGNGITKVLDARVLSQEDALAQVDQGKLAAAIVIPPDFSASLDPTKPQPSQTKITFYQDAASPLEAGIAASIVRGVVSNVVAGDIAVYVAQGQVASGKASPLLLAQSPAISQAVATALQSAPPIALQTTTVSSKASNQANAGPDPLQYFAPAMAVFFLTFSMAGGATSILEEQDGWTLQRLLSSPTSRVTILAGKLFGTYLRGLVQLTILILATALMGSLMGSTSSVWGTNVPAIILVTLAATAAAVGLGTLIAGVARTAQQADTYSNALLILLGILGGSFFNFASANPFFATVGKVTLNYWSINAYSTLAQTNSLASVLPNIVALLIIFVVFFGIGVVLFNRRLKV